MTHYICANLDTTAFIIPILEPVSQRGLKCSPSVLFKIKLGTVILQKYIAGAALTTRTGMLNFSMDTVYT